MPSWPFITRSSSHHTIVISSHDRHLITRSSSHHTIVIDLTSSCERAADFAVSGPVEITAQLLAPLPHSGLNAVRLIGLKPGTATVRMTGRRTCSHQGVTTGMCFGRNGLLGTVRPIITVT
jgi:hypothetical protein